MTTWDGNERREGMKEVSASLNEIKLQLARMEPSAALIEKHDNLESAIVTKLQKPDTAGDSDSGAADAVDLGPLALAVDSLKSALASLPRK